MGSGLTATSRDRNSFLLVEIIVRASGLFDDLSQIRNTLVLELSSEQIASDWIRYSSYRENENVSDLVFARGWLLHDIARAWPALAWEAILNVVGRFEEAELFCDNPTDAQEIVGHLAAGPLEDLLVNHGAAIIENVEVEARRDRKMAWALSGVWQNAMAEDVWRRVQFVAYDWPR